VAHFVAAEAQALQDVLEKKSVPFGVVRHAANAQESS
jgi:hypothetical protein